MRSRTVTLMWLSLLAQARRACCALWPVDHVNGILFRHCTQEEGVMAEERFHSVGVPTAQVEGPAKVAGRAVYTADVLLPGILWGKILRSPYPHARILRIDTSAALALPGVHAVLTAADLPD